jgi:hypothetical protein
MSLVSPETLICTVMEQQYNAFMSIIDFAMSAPRVFLQILKSAIQAAAFLTLDVIRSAIIIIEQQIISALNLDGFDLSKTKKNFCQALWDCHVIKKTVYDIFNIDQDAEDNYEEFEAIVCGSGLRALFEGLTGEHLLEPLGEQLDGFLTDLTRINGKVLAAVDDYMYYLNNTDIPGIDITFQELLAEIDKYAKCAFSTCNFALTSLNKKEDLESDMGVEVGENGLVMVLDMFTDFTADMSFLTNKITTLRALINDNTPKRGVPPDEVMI